MRTNKPESKSSTEPSLPELGCACATLRRCSRIVTQLYSNEMGDQLEPTQFALLSALHSHPGCGQAPLGRALGMDKTTLSRNLSLMNRNGWIEPASSGDLREKGYQLTVAGTKLLTASKPGWQRAQQKLRNELTADEWNVFVQAIDRVAAAAQKASSPSGRR